MSSASDSEIVPDHWWLYRRTDDDNFVFAYEFPKSVLCHIQQPSDWLVRVDWANGTILFSQHDFRSQAAFAFAENVMELCTMLIGRSSRSGIKREIRCTSIPTSGGRKREELGDRT